MLYYIDRNYEKIVKKFIPQIPHNYMQNEDHITARICLSKNIQGCFNAASWGKSGIFERGEFEVYRLYCFDEKDIEEGNLIDSMRLYREGLVPDADLTEEVWVINQELTPVDIKYFVLPTNAIGCEEAFLLTYEQEQIVDNTGDIPENCSSLQILQICEDLLEFLSEDEILVTARLENYYLLNQYSLKDFIPKEYDAIVPWDEDSDSFTFGQEIYFSLRHLMRFRKEQIEKIKEIA